MKKTSIINEFNFLRLKFSSITDSVKFNLTYKWVIVQNLEFQIDWLTYSVVVTIQLISNQAAVNIFDA